jgi:uncharacterized low-complexity protein
MGAVVTLILVILLSQSRFFDFLTETALGRMLILALIVFISYTSKILGLFAVLAIIIAFNQYNIEGFDISKDKSKEDKSKEDKSTKDKSKEDKSKEDKSKEDKSTKDKSKDIYVTGGREGFCMSDRETNILRGKQSNAIPVFNNIRDQDDNVNPSDNLAFSSSHSLF